MALRSPHLISTLWKEDSVISIPGKAQDSVSGLPNKMSQKYLVKWL